MADLERLIDALAACAVAQNNLLDAVANVDEELRKDRERVKEISERVTAMESDFRVLRIKATPMLGDELPPVRIYRQADRSHH